MICKKGCQLKCWRIKKGEDKMYRILTLLRKGSEPKVESYEIYKNAKALYDARVRMRVQFVALFEDNPEEDMKLIMFNNLRGNQYVSDSKND